MKKLGIDARLLSQTGVGVYVSNLIAHLEEYASPSFQIYVYLLKKDLNKINFKSKKFVKKIADFQWHKLEEQTGFLNRLNKDKLDLVHFTYFSYPVLYKRRFISTIHDLTPLTFKTGKASTKNFIFYNIKYSALKIVLSSQINNSQAIITPTQAVKDEIGNLYGDKFKKKIYVTYEGINEKIKNAKENTNLRKEFNKKFFLCVNNFYPHKNAKKLVEAFAKVKGSIKLVLVGPNDFFSQNILNHINERGMDSRIKIYNNPSLEDLVFFYKNAEALINPSLSEGFGLPNIEAAYFNCPIIASNIPVFKEVLDDSYISFNPKNIEDIAAKINYFIEKKPQFDYKDIIKRYSFEKMAKETMKIYERYL